MNLPLESTDSTISQLNESETTLFSSSSDQPQTEFYMGRQTSTPVKEIENAQSASRDENTPPVSESDQSFTRSFDSGSSSSSSRSHKSKLFSKFSFNPQESLNQDLPPIYPGNIPVPFPFEEKYLQILSKNRSEFSHGSNYTAFIRIVQKIHEVILTYLKRKPTKVERKAIAKNLCLEHPILQCGLNQTFALEEALRKRANNVEMRSSNQLGIPHVPRRKRKSAVIVEEDPTAKSQRLELIKKMKGEKITQNVLEQFPQYRAVDKCIEDLAFILSTSVNELHDLANRRWKAFMDFARNQTHQSDENSLIEASFVLSHIFGTSVDKYVLKICSDGQIFTKSNNQPYILCVKGFSASTKCSIVCDKIEFVCLQYGQAKPYLPFLLLLSTYYIMNLIYPPQAVDCLNALEYLLFDPTTTTDKRFKLYRNVIESTFT
ncbi:uncharacterized protein LOC144745801 [Ciona intestinalis]